MAKTAAQLDREITQALTRPAKKVPKRWLHGQIAKAHGVSEDVVRRIYAAVQTAKRQGLYSGYLVDLIERSVGHKLVGGEYTVATMAREYLNYNPPSGYGGPKPKGSAKEPLRVAYNDPKAERSRELIGKANRTIKEVLARRKHPTFGWDESNDEIDRAILRQVADELDVAADLYEEAGAGVSAGTLHERAKYARQGNYRVLETYDA